MALYGVTLRGTWVYDDLLVARDDPRLHELGGWRAYLTGGYFEDAVDNLWRPLTSLTFAAQWHAHGGRAWAFHAVNILLHAGVSALVAELARRLAREGNASARGGVSGSGSARSGCTEGALFQFGNKKGTFGAPATRGTGATLVSTEPAPREGAIETLVPHARDGQILSFNTCAYVAGLLFAAHPIHVEAVAYLVGRAESLAALGLLSGLVLFARRPLTGARAAGIFGCFLLAVFSKEHGLLLPPMLLAWALLRRAWAGRPPNLGPPADPRARGARQAGLLLAFALTTTLAAYVLYRDSILPWFWERVFLDPTINPLVQSSGADRWLIPVAVLGRYAALLVAPLKLSPDYSLSVFAPHQSAADPYLYAGFASLALYAVASIVAFRRRSLPAALGLLCLGMSYLLISNVLMIGTIFGERLAYLPSAFLCVLVGSGARRLPRKMLSAALAALLLAYSWRTVTYAARWNDRLAFYETSLREQPRSGQLYLLVYKERLDRGERAAAESALAQGRGAAPDAWRLWAESARMSLEAGRLDEADAFARRAFDLRPGSGTVSALWEKIDGARQRLGAGPGAAPRPPSPAPTDGPGGH